MDRLCLVAVVDQRFTALRRDEMLEVNTGHKQRKGERRTELKGIATVS